MSTPLIVACIPAYNEEKNIASVLVRTSIYVNKIIVCDDGSTDLTGEIAQKLGAEVIRHERNLGYGAALKSCFKVALNLGADIIVTLDSDGQHDPKEIPILVERLAKGDVDIVIGSRFIKGGSTDASEFRKAGIKLISFLTSNNGVKITDSQSGFRVYTKEVLDSIMLIEEGMSISTEILLKASEKDYDIAEVPVNITYHEKSSVFNPFFQGIDVILNTIKYLSMRRPLLFYGLPGFLTLCAAALFWVKIINRYVTVKTISTNITLIALSATFIGLTLTMTSIIIWVLISVVREKK